MDPVALLFLMGVAWAATRTVEHVKAEFRKARGAHAAKAKASGTPARLTRHAVAWWAGEVRHGFPVTRAGFEAGWLAHQTAMAQHRARSAASRTSHLEARASIATELAEHRKRQAEAQARIDAAGQPLLDEVAQRRKAAKERLRAARAALEANGDAEREAGIGYETERYLDLNDAVIDAEQAVKDARSLPTRRVDGKPETDADTRFFNERESGYTGPLDKDGNRPDPSDPEAARDLALLASLRQPTPPSPEGIKHMATATDTNYTEALTMAREVEAEADAALGDIRWQKMSNLLDGIGALMRGDSATLSEAADVADALKEQQKAMETTRDAAAAFASGLVRRHGGIKEAHDDAPVPAAESEFYED